MHVNWLKWRYNLKFSFNPILGPTIMLLCTTVPVFGHMYGTVPCDTIIGKLTGIYLLPLHQGLIITVAKFGQPTITLTICGSDCSLFFISIREQPCTLPLKMAMSIK